MYNIVVCDDDKEIVKAVEIYLSKEGYNVLKTYNGTECLETLKENKVHLVILDIMMPKKDGIETIKEIRKNNTIPVIMLSAKSEDEDKITGLDFGAKLLMKNPKILCKIVITTTIQVTLFHSISFFIHLSLGLDGANFFRFLNLQ